MSARILTLRMPAGLSRAVAFADGSDIIVAGGLTDAGTTDRILRLSLPGGPVAISGRLPVPVHDAGGAILGGAPVIVGGGDAVPERVVQGFTGIVGSLPRARADLVAVATDGLLVVVGGGTAAGPDPTVLATTDGRTFTHLATLEVGVRYPAVAVVDGLILVIGGTTGGVDQAAIQAIDPTTGRVHLVGRLARPVSHAAAVVLDGHLLLLGGRRNGAAVDTIEEVDPVAGTADVVGHLPMAISDAAAVVVGSDGYLVGGEAAAIEATVIEVVAGS